MRLDPKEHLEHPWLVTSLAPDFELLDVWRYPIQIDLEIPLDRFVDFIESSQREMISENSPAGALFRLRKALGRIFHWDDDIGAPENTPPIPGCREASLRDRLADSESEAQAKASHSSANHTAGPGFTLVYRLENETLREISNKTVHALMHLARVPVSDSHWCPQMAVYVKTRGRFGGAYMALISPFRHHIVYPAIIRAAKRGWPEYLERHASD